MSTAPLSEIFAGNLRAIRQERGLSQTEFAALVDMPQSYVSSLENGHNATFETVDRIAEALGIDRELLLRPGKRAIGSNR